MMQKASNFTTCTSGPSVSREQYFNEVLPLIRELAARVEHGTDSKSYACPFPLLKERGPDLLFSRDAFEALRDACESHVAGPLDHLYGIPIGVRPDLPPGFIVAGSERGRRMIREMNEAATAEDAEDTER